MILLDLPSNPLGKMQEIERKSLEIPVILDGVYFNNVYTRGSLTPPPHDVYIGSYSKLIGLNGIRIGWVATDDDLLAIRMAALITAEYCGLSVPSTDILKQTLKDFNWPLFESRARGNLNWNREDWSKLEKFFGDVPVPENGMFYYGPVDKKCKELLSNTGIGYIGGKALGTNDDFARFNLGQNNRMFRKAVMEFLENDRIK